MPQFTVDEDLAALVERLAKPKPFENLSFNAALRRVIENYVKPTEPNYELEQLLAEAIASRNLQKKATTPNPQEWAASVPELKDKSGLTSWQTICNLLGIETSGDSARRKLKNWVKANHPNWPQVPDTK